MHSNHTLGYRLDGGVWLGCYTSVTLGCSNHWSVVTDDWETKPTSVLPKVMAALCWHLVHFMITNLQYITCSELPWHVIHSNCSFLFDISTSMYWIDLEHYFYLVALQSACYPFTSSDTKIILLIPVLLKLQRNFDKIPWLWGMYALTSLIF